MSVSKTDLSVSIHEFFSCAWSGDAMPSAVVINADISVNLLLRVSKNRFFVKR